MWHCPFNMMKIDGSRVTLCSVFIDKFLCGNGFSGDEVEIVFNLAA